VHTGALATGTQHKKKEWERVDWINVAKDTDKCWAHLNIFMRENDRQLASKEVFCVTELILGLLYWLGGCLAG